PDNADYYADGYTHTNQDRYWLRGKADHEVRGWTSRLDFDIISDRDYLTEFDTGRTGISTSDKYFLKQFGRGLQDKTVDLRSNKLVTLRSWENGTSFKASLKGFDDLNEGESTALWKLPEFKYSGLLPLFDSKIDFSWDADYVNYWREEGVGAQRVDLYPKLTMAVPVLEQYLDTTVGAGVRDTMYLIDDNGAEEWQDSDSENRFLAEIEAEMSTTLRKDFAHNSDGDTFWSHSLRPFIKYKYVTDDDQEYLPQFDAVDSYGDINKITYGLKNFFYVTDTTNKQEYEREYGYIKIEQGYDLRNEVDDAPFTPVELRTAWYPVQNMNFKYKTAIDVYDDGFLKHVVEGDYLSRRGDIFSFDY
ncbi:MAG: LPS-assembly protein LptD, partial [Candidatus Electrothrix sp. AR3]|nr:LPS-assembly protein LptD [Candidatus Electrothrix sp. AR3]